TAVWKFRFSSTLVTAEGSDVTVTDVGDGAGVGLYWTVASAATLDGDTFAGNVLASAAITSNGGLTIECGRLASADANVTLIKDSISIGCGTEGAIGFGSGSGGFDQAGGSNGQVPEPATLLLFGSGLAGLLAFRRRFFPVA
ncbi:MAG: ice-binding family protein, partial [Burkholderiales bacterium]|nr:ice-binding family protein [Burkholderiales bacterium]